MTATLDQIQKAARAAGVQLYQDAYMSTAKAQTQRQLQGRTHYADDYTLKFFGARINETRQDNDGLWFALRESVQPPQSNRVHRWAIFDVFGQCERTDGRASGTAADKLLPALIASKDWAAHTAERLRALAASKEREAGAILAALAE